MKAFTLLLCLAGLLSGCSEDPATGELPGTSLPDLSLVESRAMIPLSTLSGNRFAIFTNGAGQEKPLEIITHEGGMLQQYEHFQYHTESIRIRYVDHVDDSYNPEVTALAQYSDLETSGEYVRVAVHTDINPNYTTTLVLCPDLQCPYLEKYFESIEIAGLPFSKVFANYAQPPQFNSFTKVFYTFDLGIVGFEGHNGELWALSRFE